MSDGDPLPPADTGWLSGALRFFLEKKLVVLLLTLFFLGWGARVAPFEWNLAIPRDPVPVDAIPDLGENQQIVFTEWPGRSPQDVEDQVTYPLTTAMLGVPGVRTVRSFSMFGFSSVYVLFEEGVEFYWSRSRVLEKLASLPSGSLPEGVQPVLGPDATALGQVYWYTLEGQDPDGQPTGGWDLGELRSVQDWTVRYALLAAGGVSEVASIGGFVQEYQIDVDPDALRAHGIRLEDVFGAVRMSNLDVGARTIEINSVEYVIRGLGFIESLEDIELTVVKATDGVPIYVRDVAHVQRGPALRRGALDKGGAEAVGGVVVVRYGANPLQAIGNVKAAIAALDTALPAKALVDRTRVSGAELAAFAAARGFAAFGADGGQELDQTAWVTWLRSTPRADWPEWIELSKVAVVPFYDRTGLIRETLGTLEDALTDQVLVTAIVVILMLWNLTSSILIAALLPLAVGACFILMKLAGIDANIVALSGIAIAIGTMVDMGIILTENILRRLDESGPDDDSKEVIHRASVEVGSAVLTAIATTVVGFLPVFTMTGAEGKLFKPLAFTKTFALIASVVVALAILPAAAHLVFGRKRRRPRLAPTHGKEGRWRRLLSAQLHVVVASVLAVLLCGHWLPLGPGRAWVWNFLFVVLVVGGPLLFFRLALAAYPHVLRWCLAHKLAFLSLPAAVLLFGACTWLGADRVFSFAPEAVRKTELWYRAAHSFPGLGKEFMPPLDEGSYLYMPSTMAHASIGESLDALQLQDMAIAAIPEVEAAVGKIGRVDSALDPAPISMVETVVTVKSEYATDASGRRLRFRWDDAAGDFERDEHGALVPDEDGRTFRQWRDHIREPDDVWKEIVAAAQVPGSTSAPRLQPIAARLVMLQSGMRAPMGLKLRGPELADLEQAGIDLERLLRDVRGVDPATVIADRIVGKPYLEIDLDRRALARYGLHIRDVQEVIEVAVGGKRLTTTVEGRERYPVRVRYQRELRDTIEDLGRILVSARSGPGGAPGMSAMPGAQIPLEQLAEIRYVRGPQVIKSEDTLPTAYVIFDKQPGFAEIDVIEAARARISEALESGDLHFPTGMTYAFAGTWENQVRAQRTLALVLPVALFVIFLILYLQFASVSTTLLVWSGVVVAWSGGFLMLWLYGQPWFLDFQVFGTSMRDLFGVHTINLSVAVWVGFLALFGIATDDGVVIATYLKQSFERRKPNDVSGIRAAVLAAGLRRARPCLMTTATTLLALLPVLTSRGRGADLMIPMAIPSFGGMTIALMTMLVVPVLYSLVEELRLRRA